jgi:SAM-dependent methyltransferase
MNESPRTSRARVFGRVADVYERTRPGYPDEAVRWLTGHAPPGGTVLELGAGTGQLTATLVAHGHQVLASDPSAPMLARLRRAVPAAHVVQACAEHIPLAPASVDTVVAGQAFHWFDHERALTEIGRVLRPGGSLALAWNRRDETVPWVRRLGRLIGSGHLEDPTDLLEAHECFDGIERRTFRHWQEVDRDGLVGLVRARSTVADLPEHERDAVLAKVGALYDEYGRGPDGMSLPYDCLAYRCRLSEVTGRPDAGRAAGPEGPLDDGLLIDFS